MKQSKFKQGEFVLYNKQIYHVLWIRKEKTNYIYDLIRVVNFWTDEKFAIEEKDIKKISSFKKIFKINDIISFYNENTDKIEQGSITNIFDNYYQIDKEKQCFKIDLNTQNYVQHKYLIGQYVNYHNQKFLIINFHNNLYRITNYQIVLDLIKEIDLKNNCE